MGKVIQGRVITTGEVVSQPYGTLFDRCKIYVRGTLPRGYHFHGCQFFFEELSPLELFARGLNPDQEPYRVCGYPMEPPLPEPEPDSSFIGCYFSNQT